MKRLTESIRARLAEQGNFGQMLIKTAMGSMGIKLAYTVIGFLNTVLLAKILGPAGFGVYSYAFALMMFLSIPTQLGIPSLVIREMAVANAHHRWSRMKGLIIRAHQGIVLMGIAIVAVAVSVILGLDKFVEPVKQEAMIISVLMVPVVSLGFLRAAMFTGLRHVILGQVIDEIIRPVIFLLLVVALYCYATDRITASTVMFLQGMAYLLVFMIAYPVFKRIRPAELAKSRPEYDSLNWLKSSIPLGLSGALFFLNNQTGILVLGILGADADAGIYKVATQVAVFVSFGFLIMNSIQGPHIAHLYTLGEKQQLQAMLTKGTRLSLVFTLPIVAVLVVFGSFLIEASFGTDFRGAYIPLVILSLGQAFNAAMGPVSVLLNMAGFERETMKAVSVATAANVVANVVLIWFWGAVGASLASTLTTVVLMLYLRIKMLEKTGMDTIYK